MYDTLGLIADIHSLEESLGVLGWEEASSANMQAGMRGDVKATEVRLMVNSRATVIKITLHQSAKFESAARTKL